jgi:hypothetical protein
MMNQPIELEGTWEEISALASRYPGSKMRLTILPEDTSKEATEPGGRTLEEKIADLSARVPAEEWAVLPADMGDHLDHYLYGTPRHE